MLSRHSIEEALAYGAKHGGCHPFMRMPPWGMLGCGSGGSLAYTELVEAAIRDQTKAQRERLEALRDDLEGMEGADQKCLEAIKPVIDKVVEPRLEVLEMHLRHNGFGAFHDVTLRTKDHKLVDGHATVCFQLAGWESGPVRVELPEGEWRQFAEQQAAYDRKKREVEEAERELEKTEYDLLRKAVDFVQEYMTREFREGLTKALEPNGDETMAKGLSESLKGSCACEAKGGSCGAKRPAKSGKTSKSKKKRAAVAAK